MHYGDKMQILVYEVELFELKAVIMEIMMMAVTMETLYVMLYQFEVFKRDV